MRAALRRGMIIVTATLCAASAQAQNERSDDRRPAMSRPLNNPPQEAPDAFCRADSVYRLTAIDRAVCAERTLLDKHLRVGVMQRSLQRVAGFPRMMRLEQMHRAWLDDRAQCTGPDVTACLDRLYEERIHELADAIVMERQSKP
jgi:hypothetical protein